MDNSTPERAYRLETFGSAGHVSSIAAQQLRCYFVARCDFPTAIPAPVAGKRTEIRTVSDKSFLERASPNTLEMYQKIMWNVEDRYGPVIEIFEVEGSREHRIVIGYKMGGTSHYFSALSELYHFYGLYSARKYVEQFANGVTSVSLYFNPVPGAGARDAPPIEHSIVQVIKEPRCSTVSRTIRSSEVTQQHLEASAVTQSKKRHMPTRAGSSLSTSATVSAWLILLFAAC